MLPSWHLPGEAGEGMSLSGGGHFLNQGSNHTPPERKSRALTLVPVSLVRTATNKF